MNRQPLSFLSPPGRLHALRHWQARLSLTAPPPSVYRSSAYACPLTVPSSLPPRHAPRAAAPHPASRLLPVSPSLLPSYSRANARPHRVHQRALFVRWPTGAGMAPSLSPPARVSPISDPTYASAPCSSEKPTSSPPPPDATSPASPTTASASAPSSEGAPGPGPAF